MTWYEILFGAVLCVSSIVLVVIIVLQQGRQAGLSGAIAGGAETFFGKNKGRTMEAKLAKITKYIAIGFFLIALTATLLFLFI